VTFQLKICAGENGNVDPKGEITVKKLSHVYINAQPQPGYQVDMWYVNGDQFYGGTKQFRIRANDDNLNVHVTFTKI
jgi:hypothetical protein